MEKMHGSGHQALLVLALALAEQLLVPLVHHGEVRLKAGQQSPHSCPCGTGCCAPRHSGKHSLCDAALGRASSGRRQRPAISSSMSHAGAGDGQQANSGQDRVAAADVIGNDEGGPALLSSQLLEGAFGTVGRGVDAACWLPQHQRNPPAACAGRGKPAPVSVVVPDLEMTLMEKRLPLVSLMHVVQGGGRDRVAAEVDLRAVGSLVVVQALDGLH